MKLDIKIISFYLVAHKEHSYPYRCNNLISSSTIISKVQNAQNLISEESSSSLKVILLTSNFLKSVLSCLGYRCSICVMSNLNLTFRVFQPLLTIKSLQTILFAILAKQNQNIYEEFISLQPLDPANAVAVDTIKCTPSNTTTAR